MKKTSFSKVIGIVGGAGPMASACLYSTIIELCQKQYDSHDYNEFPEIILESYPFVRGDGKKIQEDILLCFEKLKSAGAELFCIASNSFHAYLPDVSSLTFVNLVSESLQEATTISKALVLGSQVTIDLKLYEQSDLLCCYPPEKEQKLIQKIIREVAGGVIERKQSSALREIIQRLQGQLLFDGVIIACTELPLIHRKFSLSDKEELLIIDTVEVLAKRLLDLASN